MRAGNTQRALPTAAGAQANPRSLDFLGHGHRNVIIWGAGDLGRHLCGLLGAGITCFWDVRATPSQRVNSIPVYSPFSHAYPHDTTVVIIAIGNDETAHAVAQQLERANYPHMFGLDCVRALHQQELLRFHVQNASAPKNGTVFVGDSIIAQFDLQRHFLQAKMPLCNRGLSGDTARCLLTHLNESILELQPQNVFLCTGTNDLNMQENPKAVAASITAIADAVRVANITCHVISLLPVNTAHCFAVDAVQHRDNGSIRQCNALLQQILQGRDHTAFLDAHNVLCDARGQLDEHFTPDGLHLNAEGYAHLSQLLQPHIV